MARALTLAERGRGRTSPNPMVGAVVVDAGGVVVGRGLHECAGGPHAEVHALAEAGSNARGATLFCTLEPCCHTGRTGPCAPRVVAAGIRRAVVAMEDPNPLVSGRGVAHLRARGIDVTVGPLREQAERLNRPFLTVMRRGRPFVTMKIALSRDGMVGEATARMRLTCAAADRFIHRDRAEVDAIAVGSGTILADDPVLTARGAYRYRPLVRVVFDRRLRTPATARVLSTLSSGPVIIVSTTAQIEQTADNATALAGAGARLLGLNERTAGFLEASLVRVAEEGINSLLIEGGPTLHRAMWDARLVDRVQLFVTPRVVGERGVPWIGTAADVAASLSEVTTTALGDDILIEGYVHRTD
jgi:diaminohydroxyphosphoribosylaminopyrimidine deaminase/5-amino-6-(5-phosphoribosylamino)uracil reductase